MKILVNCYACSPYKGSEPGMGWNFVRCLSRLHELHIITESKFKPDIDKYFAAHPDEMQHIHFYFIKRERHRVLRKLWPPSYYWFYEKWQKKALEKAKELDRIIHFDVVHQLNMVGYREPGFLYELGKPFVWGPMGGFNITPWRLLPTMGLKGMVFYGMRNLINAWQMRHSQRVDKAIAKSSAVICATQEDKDAVKRLWNKDAVLIPEVGLQALTQASIHRRAGRMKICWSGLHIPRKSLNLLIEAMAQCKHSDSMELHVIGQGECTEKWKKLAERKHLNNIEWYGWVSREQALEIMQDAHLFVITSLSDATSTVLLEALSLGLPVVALNHLGFANVITDHCGIKIDLHDKRQIVADIAQALDMICDNEDLRMKMAHSAISRAHDFLWEDKAKVIDEIYNKAIRQ